MNLAKLSDNTLQGYFRTAAQGFMGVTSAAQTWNTGTLYYIALERNGGNLRLYKGTTTAAGGGTASMLAKTTGLSGAAEAANAALKIGSLDNNANKIDEFRLKIGSGSALYATDTSYTIPALPFPRS
jgi:hypothetical protein